MMKGARKIPAEYRAASKMKRILQHDGLVFVGRKKAGMIATARGFIMREVERRSAEAVGDIVAVNARTARRVARLSGFPHVTLTRIR